MLILKLIFADIIVKYFTTIGVGYILQLIKIEQAESGMRIAKNIYDETGSMLLGAGLHLKDSSLELLKTAASTIYTSATPTRTSNSPSLFQKGCGSGLPG